MNDITALTQRLASLMQENSVPMSDSWGRLFDALRVGDTENERMARDLISRNGEIEGLRKRVEELEEIATDYGMKFQRAQDDLKKMALMKSRTVTVKLPDSFYPDGDIELPLVMNEYQVIEALVAAGCKPVAVCPRCKRELDLSVKHDGAHYCHSTAGIQVIEGAQTE